MATACLDPDTVLGWLDGQLSIRRVSALEAHIDGCSQCRRLVSETATGGFDDASAIAAADQPERLGPYEIRGVVGRGGMGEVYRAYDPRLDREVAVKVVRAAGRRLSPADLDWFEREARAAAAIAHPNVVAVFDVGHHAGAPYVVTELLAGETLRARLKRGPIPTRQAVPWARELAHGMAAAHDRGVVHRDLKPENVFVTTDGRVKILDFGVATILDRPGIDTGELEEPGTVVGTLGYMAPEQLRGEPVDHRTDVFAFGCVLYEMVTGIPAFRAAGDGDLELAEAALDQDPFDRDAEALAAVPWSVVQVMRRCLDKSPGLRFQSARDLAFALDMLGAEAGVGSTRRGAPADDAGPRRRWWLAGVAVAVAAAGLVGYGLRARRAGPRAVAAVPTITPVDARSGRVIAARFGPYGKVYVSASFDRSGSGVALPAGNQILVRGPDDPELVPAGFPAGVALLAVSPTQIAGLRDVGYNAYFTVSGELVVYGLDGAQLATPGAGRVDDAELLPDGTIAVVRGSPQTRIEAPVGTVRYEDFAVRVFGLRASAHGDLAFLQRAYMGDGATKLMRIEHGGGDAHMITAIDAPNAVAWIPGTDQLVVSGNHHGADGVWRIAADGRAIAVWESPGPVVVFDVAADGALLIGRDGGGLHSFAGEPERRATETDVSWRDAGLVVDVSADGSTVAQLGLSAATGWRPQLHVEPIAGGLGVTLDGVDGGALSPDGKRVVVRRPGPPWAAVVYTVDGSAAPIEVDHGKLEALSAAAWLGPDELVLLGHDPGAEAVLYRVVLGAPARKLGTWPAAWAGYRPAIGLPTSPMLGPGPRAWRWFRVSPDATRIADYDGGTSLPVIVDLATLTATPVANAERYEYVAGWVADGTSVYLVQADTPEPGSARVVTSELATGARVVYGYFGQVTSATTVGLSRIAPGRHYAYTTVFHATQLYRVDGALGARR